MRVQPYSAIDAVGAEITKAVLCARPAIITIVVAAVLALLHTQALERPRRRTRWRRAGWWWRGWRGRRMWRARSSGWETAYPRAVRSQPLADPIAVGRDASVYSRKVWLGAAIPPAHDACKDVAPVRVGGEEWPTGITLARIKATFWHASA